MCTFSISERQKVVQTHQFFDLEMRFAPQWRALFRHLDVQKWSEHVVLLTFLLGNVLRATTAWSFLPSQLLKVVRSWGALYNLTWKCASRHIGVQFFISYLARWQRTRRFSARTCIFFLLTFSPLWSSHFCSSPLWLFPPAFPSVHIVGSLTSKLPSTKHIY